MVRFVRAARRLAVAAVATLVFASCGSVTPSPSSPPSATEIVSPTPSAVPTASALATPSPTPSATETPSPSPEPSPSPSPEPSLTPDPPALAWPFRTNWSVADVLFRPDGGVVVTEVHPDPSSVRLVALDRSGRLQAGWPWEAPSVDPVGGYPAVHAALAPDGTVVAVIGTNAGASSIHRIDRNGRERPGYPVAVAGLGWCHVPIVAASGIAYVTCDLLDKPDGETVRALTYALRPSGASVRGWPVRTGPLAQDAQFGAGGAIYLTTLGKGYTRIVAMRPDGSVLPGWPRHVPSGSTVAVGPGGRLWVTLYVYGPDPGQCGPPVRTRYLVLGRDGRALPGWPVTVAGWSSEPTISAAGTMYVATQRGRMIAYSSAGKVRAGWPVSIPLSPAACYGGSRPQLAGAGTVLVAGSKATFGKGVVAMATVAGAPVAGWPVRLGYELATVCRFCTPGPGPTVAPAIGAKRIYVGAYAGDLPRVVVLDRAGRMPSASQRRLATSGNWELAWIRIAPTGRVWTLLQGPEGGGILQPIAQDRLPATP